MTAIVLIWLVLALCTAVAANARGRNPVGWFLIAALLSPLIGLLLLIAFPTIDRSKSNIDQHLQRNIARGATRRPGRLSAGTVLAIVAIAGAVIFWFANFVQVTWHQ